jgi:dihydroorotase-like cyclic amidohydrolase
LLWTFDAAQSKSKSRNTPFDKRTMRGAAVATIVGGRVLYRHPELARLTAEKQGEATLK